MKILLATCNSGKIREFSAMCSGLPIEIVAAKSLQNPLQVVEDGETFRANALKKATAYYESTGMATIADDSGICVDALAGFPGVISARFLGDGRPQSEFNQALLDRVAGKAARSACFVASLAFIAPGVEYCCEGVLLGRLAAAPAGTQGFGYDPIFVPSGYDQTMAQLGGVIKNKISHRAIAMGQMLAFLQAYLAGESS